MNKRDINKYKEALTIMEGGNYETALEETDEGIYLIVWDMNDPLNTAVRVRLK